MTAERKSRIPKLPMLGLALLLTAALHLDWHLARPLHHRLSLQWQYHWVATAAVFGMVGWWIARRWPDARWMMGVAVFALALIGAQVVEPLGEMLLYRGVFGYDVEPARWTAFFRAVAASAVVYFSALHFCAAEGSALRAA
jgi:hypothetical protein